MAAVHGLGEAPNRGGSDQAANKVRRLAGRIRGSVYAASAMDGVLRLGALLRVLSRLG